MGFTVDGNSKNDPIGVLKGVLIFMEMVGTEGVMLGLGVPLAKLKALVSCGANCNACSSHGLGLTGLSGCELKATLSDLFGGTIRSHRSSPSTNNSAPLSSRILLWEGMV